MGAAETRSHLQLELGKGFDVFVSGPYVIATPRGEANRWRKRFQSLLSGYIRYFRVRHWTLRDVDFPLIVIVFPNRQQFLSYARTQTEGSLPTKAVGSYFPKTNRCIAYQLSGGQGIDWNETEATIVHEAVHQLAYNTGIHERLFKNPTWFVEGLATMFETPAVYDLGMDRGQVEARIDRRQLVTLRKLMEQPNVLEQAIESIVVSDEIFRSDPELAYALAWGMTFYFAERMPSQYQALMRAQARRGMEPYSPGQRREDFARSTRSSSGLLAVQMTRFYDSLLPQP